MRGQILLLSLIISIFLISMVSGEILLSQTNSIYNYGDNLNVKATVKALDDSSGFFNMDLVCDNSTSNFYKIPLTLAKQEEKVIDASLKLLKSFVTARSSCYVQAEFAGDRATGQMFLISDKIDVNMNVVDTNVKAGETINVQGTALKENGYKVNGFLELSAGDSVKASGLVKNGTFSVDFSFPDNQKSGSYDLNVRVYEKFKNEETNSGVKVISISVLQTPKRIEVQTESSYNPGEVVKFTGIIFDQAEDHMTGNIDIQIYDSNGNLVFQNLTASDSENIVTLARTAKPGDWNIEAEYLTFISNKSFNVKEVVNADFLIDGSILSVVNTGNIPYKKSITVSLGNYSETKTLDLEVGANLTFELTGEGQYDVVINDGDKEVRAGTVSLTGGVIGVQELKKGLNIITRYPLVWLFFILVAGLFIMNLLRKTMKRTSYSYPTTPAERKINSVKASEMGRGGIIVAGKSGDLSQAEHVQVVDGRKEQAGIIAIRINNFEEARKTGMLHKIENEIVENKGSVYKSAGFITGIFSSPTTRTFSNEIIAVRTADRIDLILKGYNKMARTIIDYGIGLHTGELIIKKDKTLNFASIGNTLNLTKRAADVAKGEFLLTQAINNKVMTEVKSERTSSGGLDLYRVKTINDRSKHGGFIQGFLDRQRK